MFLMEVFVLIIPLLILIIYLIYKPKPHIFHHSQINTKFNYHSPPKPNPLKYPLYYLTKPLIIEIHPGDILYIPYGWWHWVFSKGENIAINQWFKKKQADKPYVFKNNRKLDLGNFFEKVDGIGIGLAQDNPNIQSYLRPRVYPKDKNEIKFMGKLKEFREISKNKKYSGFVLENQLPDEYKKVCQNKIKSDSKYNLWYYSNDANSGLHYDNYDNFLYQIKGTKKIYLFPPNDSQFLYGDKKLRFNDS